MKVYVGNRAKTKQTFTIPLLSPAMAVLKKYQNKLPVISNVKYNEYLKVIAQAAGIDKPVSSHWARHTGATLLLNEGGMDLKTVAKICGHSSFKITEQVIRENTEIKTPHIFVLKILQMIPHINPQKYMRNTVRNTMLDKIVYVKQKSY